MHEIHPHTHTHTLSLSLSHSLTRTHIQSKMNLLYVAVEEVIRGSAAGSRSSKGIVEVIAHTHVTPARNTHRAEGE